MFHNKSILSLCLFIPTVVNRLVIFLRLQHVMLNNTQFLNRNHYPSWSRWNICEEIYSVLWHKIIFLWKAILTKIKNIIKRINKCFKLSCKFKNTAIKIVIQISSKQIYYFFNLKILLVLTSYDFLSQHISFEMNEMMF